LAKDPSKTETATQKRRDKAREEGQVPKGKELPKIITLVAGLYFLRWTIGFYREHVCNIFRYFFNEGVYIKATPAEIHHLFMLVVRELAIILLPLLLTLAFAAYLCQRLQVGHLWSSKILQPKFQFLQLGQGLKKIFFSLSTFVQMGRSILQAAVVALAPYFVIKNNMDKMLPLFHATPEAIAAKLLQLGYDMTFYAMLPMLVIAIADTWYTRWNYEEELKMTKDEVKDERKQAEGDPKIKQQQRTKMMKVMAQRMMKNVPKADVVVTNPTHLAVALYYDALEAPAPMVLAKGANRVAERIKEIALENNVPIRQNKPLAQALYSQVEIGEVVPEELYQAVAAILSRLDKFRKKYNA
jgi:flagellar biosynthetic protein FlhB